MSSLTNRNRRAVRRALMGSATIGVLLSSLCAAPAAAQESPNATEIGQNDIIVTATRRETTVQNAPINISAISGDELERQGLNSISEVTRSIPGINIVDQGGRGGSQIIVRGLNAEPLVSNDNSNDGGGTVATYLGETPVFIELKLNDMERVEVLLGPQGTLYGAGTLGGAIRYIPRRPQFDARTLEFRGDAYGYSAAGSLSVDAGVTVNLPITSTFAIRASADRLADSGFIDQPLVLITPGVSLPNALGTEASRAANFRRVKDVNYEDTWSGRVAARWQPSDAVDLNLTYYFQFQDVGGRQSSSARVTNLPITLGKYESALRIEEPAKRDNELVTLEGSFDLGFATLTSATSYSEYRMRSQRDQTDLAIQLGFGYENFNPLVDMTDERIREERINQEVRLLSSGDGPFNWTIGGFYNRFKRRVDYAELLPGFYSGDLRDYISIDQSRRTEYAAYGELSYDLTDAWTVTVGGRYYKYDLETSSEFAFGPIGPAGPFFFPARPGGQKDDGVLGKFNMSYEFSRDVLGYLTVSQGYRGGNSNSVTACPVPLPPNTFVCGQPNELFYTPDTTTNYEVGLKTQLFDRRLTLNGALFYIDWKNVQVSSATQVGQVGITVNGNGASSKGVELNFDAALTNQLRLRGSYSYTDAQLDELSPDLIATISPPGFSTIYLDGQKGDRLPGSAKHRGSIGLSYVAPISDGLDLDLGWNSVFSGNVLSTVGGRGGSLTLPSYSVSYARIGVVNKDDGYSVSLYADNIFNEFVEVGVRNSPLYNQNVVNSSANTVYLRRFSTAVLPPRRIGVRFTKTF